MKLITVLLLISIASEIYANTEYEIKDSSGVFFTKVDFLNNRISFGSHNIPEINWIFGIRVTVDIYWNFSVSGKIRFQMDDSSWKTFSPGEISGFYVNGHKYLYFNEDRIYLTVVRENFIWFFLETGMAPRFSLNPVKKIFYFRNPEEEPRRFTKKNISKDFGMASDTSKVLKKILDNLPFNFISGQKEEYLHFIRILNSS